MVKKTATVPDAWEDDWETQADKAVPEVEQPEPQANLTKAERLAQHTELNRKLWESAESPQTFHYIEASNNNVPFANTFKPQVKVLSRKPVIARRNPTTGMIDDDDDGAPKKEVKLTPEEIRAKQKRDHEEKQRRYEEARAKIFGSNPSSGASSPGTVTPPRSDGHFSSRGRGRGRGGYRGNNERQNVESRPFETRQFESRPFDNRRLPNPSTSGRELYDPNHSPKPEAQQKRGNDISPPSRTLTPRDEQNTPIRTPRGPDGSGRGGFGFAQRGAKES